MFAVRGVSAQVFVNEGGTGEVGQPSFRLRPCLFISSFLGPLPSLAAFAKSAPVQYPGLVGPAQQEGTISWGP